MNAKSLGFNSAIFTSFQRKHFGVFFTFLSSTQLLFLILALLLKADGDEAPARTT